MIRTLSCATAALAIVLLIAAAPASATTAKASVTPRVVLGSGAFGPGCTTNGALCDDRHLEFQLAAFSGPFGFGLPVFGTFERVNPANGGTFVGTVTCLKVIGSNAAIGGYGGFITAPSPPAPFVVYVNDDGLPGGADGISPLETFGPEEQPPVAGFPLACPTPPAPLGYFPLTSGSIVLR